MCRGHFSYKWQKLSSHWLKRNREGVLHVAEKPKVCSRQAQVNPGPRSQALTSRCFSQLCFLLSVTPGSFSALRGNPRLAPQLLSCPH